MSDKDFPGATDDEVPNAMSIRAMQAIIDELMKAINDLPLDSLFYRKAKR